MEPSKGLKLGDLIHRFLNIQDDDILGVLLEGESHVDQSLRVQATVASDTYLSLVLPIRTRLLEGLVFWVHQGIYGHMAMVAMTGRQVVLSFFFLSHIPACIS